MIKLCIFDIGGVVCHDDTDIIEKMNIFIGNPPNQPYLEMFPNFRTYFEAYEEGKIEEKDVWAAYEKETGKKMKDYGDTLFAKYFFPTLHEPTVSIIKALKKMGIRVVAGTNVLPAHYDYHKKHGQYDIFDKVYGSNIMHIRKPKVGFFTQILKEEGIEGKEAFFTDDMQINIDGAKDAGINAFLYKDEEKLKRDLESVGIKIKC